MYRARGLLLIMHYLSFSTVSLSTLKNELVRLEKRAISIITSGKCNLAIEVGLTPILEHHYIPCSKLFDNIVSDPNHQVKALLPPNYDNSSYNLRPQCHFNMPKLCTNRTSKTYICDVEAVRAVVLSHL